MFVSLPFAFGNVLFGQLMGVVFFVLVAIAAWSSARLPPHRILRRNLAASPASRPPR